jgi:hypothetical protein
MTHYILQVIVFQLLFFTVYQAVLRRETFFTYNRIYLLGTAIVSFVLPLMQFSFINEQIPEAYKIQLPTILIGDTTPAIDTAVQSLDPIIITQGLVNWSVIITGIYVLGLVVAGMLFVLKLRKLARFKKLGILINSAGYRVCRIPESAEAFTFLRTMYLGAHISEAEITHIVAHEKVHIDHWHSLDLLFFEIQKVLLWFNPLPYLYQKQLQTVHEFTADKAVASADKMAYYQNLLSQVFGTTQISFINTFFNHSLIKKRITMLQKSKSNRVSVLKYLLVIPFIAGMLIYTSCANDAEELTTNADLTSETDTEVMQKINELAEAIMKVGNLTDDESNALKLLTTETQSGDKIYTSVDEYINDSNEAGVPMAFIENVPVYPGCEGDNAERKACFSKSITTFIVNNFDTTVGKDANISGKQRILVKFRINKIGIIQDVQARAEHKELEREAERVLNQLPKMKPGMQKGEAVNVEYSMPILFVINE